MSGCVFDGKQGYGDYALSSRYDSVTLFAMIGEIVCLVLAASVEFSRRHLQASLAVAAVVLGVPLNWYVALHAAMNGTLACGPV